MCGAISVGLYMPMADSSISAELKAAIIEAWGNIDTTVF